MKTIYESTEPKERWQDWVNLCLGLWLIAVPFTATNAVLGIAAWNAYAFGIVITLLSSIALYRQKLWEEWLNFLIGIWLIASPFVLGFTGSTALMWNFIVMGILIGGDALWAALSRPAEEVRHEHPHHA